MDQEGGRRRSTRLAAKGVAPPKVETPAKKTPKSSEKSKRTKRKNVEEVVELLDSKKAKSEEPTSSDETDKPAENELNKSVEQKDVPETTPLNNDDNEKNEEAAVKEDVPAADSTKPVENMSATIEKKEIADALSAETKQSEVQESEVTAEQPKKALSPEKPVPVAVENINGKSDDKKTFEAVKGIAKIDNGFCVAAKDAITPNGDTQINAANGDNSVAKPEAIEPIKVLHDNTNHVAENDLKVAVTSPAIVNTTSNNDLSGVEQDEKEQDKVVDSTVDVIVSSSDNAPNVEQPSTVVS